MPLVGVDKMQCAQGMIFCQDEKNRKELTSLNNMAIKICLNINML